MRTPQLLRRDQRCLLGGVVALFLAACPAPVARTRQPADRFYGPTGLVHLERPGLAEGVLVVASSNFDKRYEGGSLMALVLDRVALPPFGAPVPEAGPVQLEAIGVRSEAAVMVSSFTGPAVAWSVDAGLDRIFVASRSEGMRLHAVDVVASPTEDGGVALRCHTTVGGDDRDCASRAESLTPPEFEFEGDGLPRAPSPFAVAIRARACGASAAAGGSCRPGSTCVEGVCVDDASGERLGDLWITHLALADSPAGSATAETLLSNGRAFAVRLESRRPAVSADAFVELGVGQGATSYVALGARWAYLSGVGRVASNDLLRMVERSDARVVLGSQLKPAYRAGEARGVGLSADERRLYLATRAPDALVVADIAGGGTGARPTVQVQRAVALPAGATELLVLPRTGRGDVVAVTSSSAGTLALYDDDVGAVVALVTGIGAQPLSIAAQRRGGGARLFVSNFGDGRVAVVDVVDLDRPHEARLVAHLGARQACLGGDAASDGAAAECGGRAR